MRIKIDNLDAPNHDAADAVVNAIGEMVAVSLPVGYRFALVLFVPGPAANGVRVVANEPIESVAVAFAGLSTHVRDRVRGREH